MTTSKKNWKQKIIYKIDYLLAHKIQSLIIGLFIIAAIISITFSIVVVFSGTEPDHNILNNAWKFFLKTIGDDAPDDPSIFYNILYFFIVVLSLLFSSVVIGIITQSIQQRVEEMRKGHSKIIEQNHIVILGWAPKVHTIIDELNEKIIEKERLESAKQKKEVVVIIDEIEKVKIEEELSTQSKKNNKFIKTICRSGNTADRKTLEILNLEEAKAIIIISNDPAFPDVKPIKTLLALKGYEKNNNILS